MSKPQPLTRRIARGRGHSYLLDWEKTPGVTTILGQGYPKPALVGWAANLTAGYAVDRWDELTELSISERLNRLKGARFDELREASERGSEVHQLAHRLAAGEEVDVPESLVGHIDAYDRFVVDWRPQELLVEAVVANRRWRYMGTLDAVARLADGRNWLLDFKTSRGIYADNCLQLCAYSRGEFYVDAAGGEQPLPRIDRAGIVHLRGDGYDLRPVDISEETFRVFLYVQQVARFVDANADGAGTTHIGEALAPPTPEAR